MIIKDITLEGVNVRLEPLSDKHKSDLAKVGKDEDIWRYLLYGKISTEDQISNWVNMILVRKAKNYELPFAVITKKTGRAIGSTRFIDIDFENRGLEIGGTWYGIEYQRTIINTECKYLLLCYAFDTLDFIRVQFETDSRNIKSQIAIERIGAKKEGLFRNHIITPDGSIRHSVFYSIIDSEWPDVKKRLENMLNY